MRLVAGISGPIQAADGPATNWFDTVRSWTPTDNSGAELPLTVTDAMYVQGGALCIVSAAITWPPTGNGKAAHIGGLPCAAGTMDGTPVSGCSPPAFLSVQPNASAFTLQAADGTALTNADLSGKTIRFTFTYFAVTP